MPGRAAPLWPRKEERARSYPRVSKRRTSVAPSRTQHAVRRRNPFARGNVFQNLDDLAAFPAAVIVRRPPVEPLRVEEQAGAGVHEEPYDLAGRVAQVQVGGRLVAAAHHREAVVIGVDMRQMRRSLDSGKPRGGGGRTASGEVFSGRPTSRASSGSAARRAHRIVVRKEPRRQGIAASAQPADAKGTDRGVTSPTTLKKRAGVGPVCRCVLLVPQSSCVNAETKHS